jgi:large subunit ribosomal protein L1
MAKQPTDKEQVEIVEEQHVAPTTAEETTEKAAKAGKRSSKATKEAELKAAKEERKAKGDNSPQGEASTPSKRAQPRPRPHSERRGKAYRKAFEQVEQGKTYSLATALELAKKTSVGKFNATVELHANLGVDPRQADQNIRATVSLPHGNGKTVRVAVFAPTDQHETAKKAGADIVGDEEFLAQLDKEVINFDILIATPQLMPKLGKYARLLGPRGLMPNPKSGTITPKVADAVKEAKAGRVEYRIDKQAIVHLGIGKVSFDQKQLEENAQAFLASLTSVKPTSIKGTYIKALTVATTMGPGIKVDLSSL